LILTPGAGLWQSYFATKTGEPDDIQTKPMRPDFRWQNPVKPSNESPDEKSPPGKFMNIWRKLSREIAYSKRENCFSTAIPLQSEPNPR
jgi:hypothetical protein